MPWTLSTNIRGPSRVLAVTSVKTSDYTAVAGEFVRVSAVSGNRVITLPVAVTGDEIIVSRRDLTGNTVTLQRSGTDLFDQNTTTIQLRQYKEQVHLVGVTGAGWYVVHSTARILPQALSLGSSATPAINTDLYEYVDITGLATAITSFTTNLTGTPVNGQKLWISITGTASRAIAWGSSFENGAATLPTTTSGTTRLDVGFIWNSATSKWRCMAAG